MALSSRLDALDAKVEAIEGQAKNPKKRHRESIDSDSDDSTGDRSTERDETIARLSIFFAIIDINSTGNIQTITPAHILPEFRTLLSRKPGSQFHSWSQLFHDTIESAHENKHFISHAIKDGFVPNAALFTYFTNGDFVTCPLAETLTDAANALSYKVALLHFAPPIKDDPSFAVHLDKNLEESVESRIHQASRHQTKRNTKLFTNTGLWLPRTNFFSG